jgi:hypothetical protein
MKEYRALRRKLWNEHPNHMGYLDVGVEPIASRWAFAR